MPIKFKAIERGEPGVPGGGTKKWYATTVIQGERNIDQLTTSIEKISTVSGADIRAVLYAMVDVCTEELANGNIVRFGDLGSMRVSISSVGAPTALEVNSSIITKNRILFNPGPRLVNMLGRLIYQKA
ncbi:HU family DNA-binding protein [uncultured Polaribacter sp.]|uniref:HU family DNA-binding protein n=1 Tax=uncultured Polaribacter sp. TaxID=174711 RepID=UPI0026120075|nr:HU family DNA-binding protein [uncultured Polaribacter sp.]